MDMICKERGRGGGCQLFSRSVGMGVAAVKIGLIRLSQRARNKWGGGGG